METKQHWENVFATKQQNEVSWYQPTPQTSIDFFSKQNIPTTANVIDIGCGDSYFIDHLVNNNYKNVYALDISANAIERLKKRIGNKADNVNWIVSNINNFNPNVKFEYWHDRAVFHFLTETNEIQNYVSLVNKSIETSGYMMIATFSKNGPLKCSGLNISQYNVEDLSALFSEQFECIDSTYIEHPTPFNTTQNFTFCLFRKIK